MQRSIISVYKSVQRGHVTKYKQVARMLIGLSLTLAFTKIMYVYVYNKIENDNMYSMVREYVYNLMYVII